MDWIDRLHNQSVRPSDRLSVTGVILTDSCALSLCVADGLCVVVPEVSHISVHCDPAGTDLGLSRTGGTGKVDVVAFLLLHSIQLFCCCWGGVGFFFKS